MSLIFGVNLSDKIYLIADTRASKVDYSGNILNTKDNVMKIIQLTNDCAVVCGGDVHLIKYIVSRLKKSKILHSSVCDFKSNIKSWIGNQVGDYLNKGFPYKKACFLFAAMDRTKNKIIDGHKYIKMSGEFQELKKSSMSMKDVVFKGISDKKNQNNSKPDLPINDTVLFSVSTDAKNNYLDITEAEWGEYIVYGPKNFDKSKVPKSLFGQLEFEAPIDKGNPTFRDVSLLTAFVKDMENSQKLLTVGGSVTSMVIGQEADGVVLVTCKVHRMALNGISIAPEVVSETIILSKKLCTKNINGIYERLVDINKYPTENYCFVIA